MKTYIFYCKNAPTTIVIPADSEQEAFSELEELVTRPYFFRLGEVMEEWQTPPVLFN